MFSLFGYSSKEKFLRAFARVGLAAKGVVYCLLAVLAFTIALGFSKRKGNKNEAFQIIVEQPFGQVILVIIAVSLLGFVLLRFFQAVLDSDGKGSDLKGVLRRLGLAGSGLIYLGISFYALKIAFGSASNGNSKQFIVAKILEYPGGNFLVTAIAAVVIGQGIYQLYRALSGKFMKKIKLYNSGFRGTFQKIGVIGYSSRGIVLCLIGYLLFRAAYDTNPKEAGGTETAFSFVQNQFGDWLLGIIAAGLLAYGLFMFVRAKHQKIHMIE